MRAKDILHRHAEDAAFLWKRRQAALRSTMKHAERVRLDERIEAHVDALRSAGDAGLWVAFELTRGCRRVGGVFAAAVLALGHESCGDLAERLWSDAAVRPTGFAEVVSAIGWSDVSEVSPLLAQWGASEDPWLARLGLAGFGAHRRHPGAALAAALRRPDAALRAIAAKVAGELGDGSGLPALRELVADGDAWVRLAAARSAARFVHDVTVTDALVAIAEGDDARLAEAAAVALMRVEARDGAALVRHWASGRSTKRIAIVAAEALGDPTILPLLIGWMSDDVLARRAGDAFAAIVGVDLAERDLARPKPAIVPDEPTDDPDDPRVELGPDQAMLFPAPLKVAAWWRANGHHFAAARRCLNGTPLDGQGMSEKLLRIARTGPPRCQALAAGILGQAVSSSPTLETHAPATWQHALLPGWTGGVRVPTRIAHGRRTSTRAGG